MSACGLNTHRPRSKQSPDPVHASSCSAVGPCVPNTRTNTRASVPAHKLSCVVTFTSYVDPEAETGIILPQCFRFYWIIKIMKSQISEIGIESQAAPSSDWKTRINKCMVLAYSVHLYRFVVARAQDTRIKVLPARRWLRTILIFVSALLTF